MEGQFGEGGEGRGEVGRVVVGKGERGGILLIWPTFGMRAMFAFNLLKGKEVESRRDHAWLVNISCRAISTSFND